MRHMNILIVDFYASSNRGDAAILDGMRNTFRTVFPEAKITVLAYLPQTVKVINSLPSEKVFLEGMPLFSKKFLFLMVLILSKRLSILGRIIKWISSRYKQNQFKLYFEADLVISVGGAHLNDNYEVHLRGRLFGLWLAKVLGKKVVLYAQSLGPFKHARNRFLAKAVFNRLDSISVRDEDSKRVLTELGVVKPSIVVTADAAFAMSLDLNERERLVLQQKIAAEGDPFGSEGLTVSISLRDWPLGKLKNEKYLEIFTAFVNWLIEKKNAKIILCSTCTGFGGYHMDDRIQGFCLKEKVYKKENIFIFTNEYRPAELAKIYGKVSLHVGTRMHSCILAMLAETVAIPIGYEKKSIGLMRPMGLEQLVINYDQLSVEALIERFNEVTNNLEKYRALVKRGVDTLKVKESLNEKMIRDVMMVSA